MAVENIFGGRSKRLKPRPLRPMPLLPGMRTDPRGKSVNNAVLLELPEDEFSFLRPHPESVELPQYQILSELAQMLGTGRPSVSLAAGILQRAGMIENLCTVKILNRKELEASACECYHASQYFNGGLGIRWAREFQGCNSQ